MTRDATAGLPAPLRVSRAPEAARPARRRRKILDHFEPHLHHRHEHHLRDAVAGVDGEGRGAAIPAPTPSAVPDSRNRSDRPDCRARCRSCGPNRSAAAAPRQAADPRCKSKCRSESARRRRARAPAGRRCRRASPCPAEPAVACCGRGNSRPMRGSRIRSLTVLLHRQRRGARGRALDRAAGRRRCGACAHRVAGCRRAAAGVERSGQ